MKRGRTTLGLALPAALALAAPAGVDAPLWRLEQPAPPPGAPFKVPLGRPGDLQFWAPNRGLLGIEGNATIARGLYYYDGEIWRALATVCGGPAETLRIAWAGPTEFWTVSEPSRPRIGSGLTLCHFSDGQVVASYGTPAQAADPYRTMNAAACRGPDDCWFGGIGTQDPTGERTGAFHLHWDGSALTTRYNQGKGRGVSDLEAWDGGFAESVFAGRQREGAAAEQSAPESPGPRLLHRIAGGAFADDPFTPAPLAGVPEEGSELLALDADGARLWAVGGGAGSGPAKPADGGAVARPPLAAVADAGGPVRELDLRAPATAFGATDRFGDVAAVPGTGRAWVTVVPFADRDKASVRAHVALLDAGAGLVEQQRLPAGGSARGAAARIAFTGPADGWLVTQAGWLFHYTDGTRPERDAEPAFQSLISFRPNESAEQFVPDAPPLDDSQLFAPPPVTIETVQTPPAPQVRRLKALLQRVRSKRRGLTLIVSFRLVRRARVQLLARRKGSVVAKTARRTLRPGRHTLKLKLSRRQWPTSLKFATKELTLGGAGRRGGRRRRDHPMSDPFPLAAAVLRRRRRALRRTAAGLLGLGLLAAAFAPGGAPAQEGAVSAAQPVLGSADAEAVLMGAAQAMGETWAYRELPLAIGAAVAGGTPVGFAPQPSASGAPVPQLAFLRHGRDGDWQVVETPAGPGGTPIRGPQPNSRSARITPRGGGMLIGRDRRRPAGARLVALVRNPGGRFAEVAPPPAGMLATGEALAGEEGAGRIAGAAVDGPATTVFLAAVGPATETAVLRFDGASWTREPIEQPPDGLQVLALDATSPANAWLLARAPGAGVLLFQRAVENGAAAWRARTLARVPAGTALDGAGRPLTVTAGALWIDGELAAGGDFTLHAATGGAGDLPVHVWCDAPGCDEPLGLQFSRQQGYVSQAWPDGGPYGSRVITNPLAVGGDDQTNMGTWARLAGTAFARLPGGGGDFRPSGAFLSPSSGWLEGPVEVTDAPRPARMKPWPVALRAPLNDAVPAPGQPPGALESAALAAGSDGAIARYAPGRGWEREFLLSSSGSVARPVLRGVAWPEPARAHAVGDLGALWMWRSETRLWERDPGTPVGFEANLMDVAFAPGDPYRGYAVGKGGALLRYDKTWLQEPLPEGFAGRDLTQVAFAGEQALVAAGGDLLGNGGAGWAPDPGVRALFAGLPEAPRLVAVAGLPDGGAVAAGAGVVIERDGPDAAWRFADQPLPGATVVALAAVRDGARVRAVASVVPRVTFPVPDEVPDSDPNEPPPLIPPFPLAGDGYLLRETAGGWRDEQRTAFAGSGPDRPAKSDPVAALVLDAAGAGWAIGGWSGQADSAGRGSGSRSAQGRADRARVQTASVARYAPEGDPAASPGTGAAPTAVATGPVRLAVGGHAACAEDCADLRNQDLGPDRLLAGALRGAAGLAAQPGGPRAFLYTGGRVPAAGAARPGAEARRYAELLGGGGIAAFPARAAGDEPAAFRAAFAGAPAPFGAGGQPGAIGGAGIPGAAAASGARTHYAFDSTGAEGTVRVVVIDNAAGSLEASDPDQNPPEAQAPWLVAVLADAKAKGIPALVVGSRDLNPRFTPALNAASDGDAVAQLLVEGGASAYFFERPEENRATAIPSGGAVTIPAFGTGTLGYRSPVSEVSGSRPDALFGDAGYLLAEVDVAGRDPQTNRAPVGVRLLPVVEDLTVQSVDGTLLRRSRPALFQGLGRRPVAGDRWGAVAGGGNPEPPGGDPYTAFPPAPCLIAGCSTRLSPEYAFTSSDPDIGDFVRRDPLSSNQRKPFIGPDDRVLSDAASGLFCPFNAGTTTVTLRAGGLVHTQQVTVLAGSVQRPCGTRPLNPERFTRTAPSPATAVPPAPAPAPAPAESAPPPVPPPPPSPPPVPPERPARAQPAPKPVAVVPPPPAPPLDTVPPPAAPPAPAVPGAPPPPGGGFARPIPPGGAVVRVFEEKREEEAAPEQSQAASVFHHDDQAPLAPWLLAVALLGALAGASLSLGTRRRERRADLAVAALQDPYRVPYVQRRRP